MPTKLMHAVRAIIAVVCRSSTLHPRRKRPDAGRFRGRFLPRGVPTSTLCHRMGRKRKVDSSSSAEESERQGVYLYALVCIVTQCVYVHVHCVRQS